MRRLLVAVLVVLALLVVDSVYLGAVSFVQWLTGQVIENGFYQAMFLVHLALGTLVIAPTIVFGAMHLRRAINRPNRIAVRLGLGLFVTALLLFASGIALTRGLPWFELKHELARVVTYWLARTNTRCRNLVIHSSPSRWSTNPLAFRCYGGCGECGCGRRWHRSTTP